MNYLLAISVKCNLANQVLRISVDRVEKQNPAVLRIQPEKGRDISFR